MNGDIHVRFCEGQRGKPPLPTRLSATPEGATASATIYSLIETAKANALEPYRYLRYMFERLPLVESDSDYKALLPQYIDRNSILSMNL